MTTYSKLNVVYRLQKWMDSVAGQTFLNYAYSWGASIVILGTLFKLTHLPGANFFLFLGMGTEVFVFFISAFDRPFDKTTDGMELDLHMQDLESSVVANGESRIAGGGGGGTVIIGDIPQQKVDTEAIAAVSSSAVNVSGGAIQLPEMNPELEAATTDYVTELKRLTDMLARISEQSEKLGRNAEEMDNLDRTLTGITKVYEMQLKSASQQIGTIDEINEQTKRMAKQIVELNQIYQRMIEAMTVNMPQAAPKGQM